MAPRRESLNSDVEDNMLDTVPGMEQDTGDEFSGVDDSTPDEGGPDGGSGSERQQPDPNQQRQADDAQVRYDQAGNVIDARGNVIAPAGRGRRLDEQNRRYRGLLEAKEKELHQAQVAMAEAKYLNGAPSQLGLNADETAAALDMMALFKSNPSQLVQIVLAEASSKGVDLNKLLGSNIGTVQTDAIKKMLDERFAPLDKMSKERAQEAQLNQAVQTRYNTFLTKYPDADPHQDAIANLMRTQGLHETEAYFRVREFALRNGLNFDQPLGPQLAAIMQQGGQQPRQQASRRRPIVNGRGPSNGQMTERRTEVASPDRSYASIVEEALAEAGYQG
jgi:hypothetical protein